MITKRDKLGRIANQGKLLEAECIWCSNTFDYYKTIKDGKFCSYRCCKEYRKKYGHLKSNKNPNWKGGINQDYYQRIIKDNLDISSCSICGSKKFILIHHKDKNRKNNKLSNLQVLCKSCHSKTHNIINSIGDKNGREEI